MTKNNFSIRMRRLIKLLVNGIAVLSRELYLYIRYSNSINYYKKEDNFLSIIVANYHVIEKGLTMPDFRFGFGQDKIRDLMEDLIKYEELNFSLTNTQYKQALSIVKEYFLVHDKIDYKLPKELLELYKQLVGDKEIIVDFQKDMTTDAYFIDDSDFFQFSNSRHSLRNFSSENVDIKLVNKAIDLSRNTPTPCNRQPNKVYVVSDKDIIKQFLELQGGSRGFGHLVNKLLLITTDLSKFSSIREIHESYKSGGMYSMNLLYALHYFHIGACSLQWGEQPKKDKLLRKLIMIPPNEQIIMGIAIGIAPESFKLANSMRNDLSKSVKYS